MMSPDASPRAACRMMSPDASADDTNKRRVKAVRERFEELGAEVSEAARLAGVRAVCAGALGDQWSEVRKACAKRVGRLELSPKSRAALIREWAAAMRETPRDDWRRIEGLCLALASFAAAAVTGEAVGAALVEAARSSVIPLALVHSSLAVREAAAKALPKSEKAVLVSTVDELRRKSSEGSLDDSADSKEATPRKQRRIDEEAVRPRCSAGPVERVRVIPSRVCRINSSTECGWWPRGRKWERRRPSEKYRLRRALGC
ncbi:hypothetical protein M885DRAFT_315981 [Pelagophyceae sp. CCMP2097]|nr:hypothetical protein M885DRAFT_315981 [Pelagophyceae sp. CCMP2097]